MNVFDASALLAFLGGEDGADAVEQALGDGGAVGAANWSEVAQKVMQHGRDWESARALLLSYDLTIQPVTEAEAEGAARLWATVGELSLGDRLCLALGERVGTAVLTADRRWGSTRFIQQIR